MSAPVGNYPVLTGKRLAVNGLTLVIARGFVSRQPQHHRRRNLWRRRAGAQGHHAFIANGCTQRLSGHNPGV